MKSILRRIEIVERAVGGSCAVPEKERIVVISCPDGEEAEFERLKAESIAKLQEKYGPSISEDDLLVIWVRKFYQKQLPSDDATPEAEER
ncbi:MAG: hypothetical protein ACYC5X_12060 [Syntrophales bacterium]